MDAPVEFRLANPITKTVVSGACKRLHDSNRRTARVLVPGYGMHAAMPAIARCTSRCTRGSVGITRLMRRLRCLVVASAVSALAIGRLEAQQRAPTASPVPLQGVVKTTVGVILNQSSASPIVGVTEARLRTMIELRLRSAGLRVVTAEEDLADPDINPAVALDLTLLPAQDGRGLVGYAFSTGLDVTERQRLASNGAAVSATLWHNRYLNIASERSTQSEVERVVNQLLDELVNAWLQAKSP